MRRNFVLAAAVLALVGTSAMLAAPEVRGTSAATAQALVSATPVASTSRGLQIVATDGLVRADYAYRPLTGDGQ